MSERIRSFDFDEGYLTVVYIEAFTSAEDVTQLAASL